jgi:hypothetical protein
VRVSALEGSGDHERYSLEIVGLVFELFFFGLGHNISNSKSYGDTPAQPHKDEAPIARATQGCTHGGETTEYSTENTGVEK